MRTKKQFSLDRFFADKKFNDTNGFNFNRGFNPDNVFANRFNIAFGNNNFYRYLLTLNLSIAQFMQLPRNEKRRLKSLFMATLQPVKNLAFQSNLGASSGLSSYDDNEEEDFSGMGAGTDQSVLATTPWYEQVGKAAAGLAVPLATYQLEKQRNKINLQRAKQGLEPIDTGATATVGLSNDTKKLIYVGIGSLVLIVLLPKLMK